MLVNANLQRQSESLVGQRMVAHIVHTDYVPNKPLNRFLAMLVNESFQRQSESLVGPQRMVDYIVHADFHAY